MPHKENPGLEQLLRELLEDQIRARREDRIRAGLEDLALAQQVERLDDAIRAVIGSPEQVRDLLDGAQKTKRDGLLSPEMQLWIATLRAQRKQPHPRPEAMKPSGQSELTKVDVTSPSTPTEPQEELVGEDASGEPWRKKTNRQKIVDAHEKLRDEGYRPSSTAELARRIKGRIGYERQPEYIARELRALNKKGRINLLK